MAANSQHRCVFVGNIPYDATEEQLIQICEEVGPVVSFRLVIDRETGKPKGYGFCEYKDEETALSARRNLQGYEINGRQLRVDFAENDKGADRTREQGRGGPGMATNVDPQKQVAGAAILGESAHQQPIGLPLAMTAASVMAGVLGGSQVGSIINQNGLQSQSVLGNDPLTLHLAKMSRNHLNEIFSELKGMCTQNKEQARKLLLSSPQLSKALFQAQIMLGMATPQMLQMPNIRQAPIPLSQPVLQDVQQIQPLAVQTLPGQSPLAQSNLQFGMMPKVGGQISSVPPNASVPNQFSLLPQPRIPLPQQVQPTSLPEHSGVPTRIHNPQPLPSLSIRPNPQTTTSLPLKQQIQPPQLSLTRPPISDSGSQPGISINKDVNNRSVQVTDNATWVRRNNTYSNLPSGPEIINRVPDTSEPINRPSKMLKVNEGQSTPLLVGGTSLYTVSGPGPSQIVGTSSAHVNLIPKAEEAQPSELTPDVESALLQQVMNLTPEQLSLLPPEQQEEVIQLQQMLRQSS